MSSTPRETEALEEELLDRQLPRVLVIDADISCIKRYRPSTGAPLRELALAANIEHISCKHIHHQKTMAFRQAVEARCRAASGADLVVVVHGRTTSAWKARRDALGELRDCLQAEGLPDVVLVTLTKEGTCDGSLAWREVARGILDHWRGGGTPQTAPPQLVDAALDLARTDLAGTLIVPSNVIVDTKQDGDFWSKVLRALHELCLEERAGRVASHRDALRELLARNGLPPKRTYKRGDTEVWVVDPESGKRHRCRNRVHLVEGAPAETESIYWHTLGEEQASFRYLIARLGKHS